MSQPNASPDERTPTGYHPLSAVTLVGGGGTGARPREWRFASAAGEEARIAVLAQDIVRVRLLAPGMEPARSWAVERENWDMASIEPLMAGREISTSQDGVSILLQDDPFQFSVRWSDGMPLAELTPRGMGRIAPPGANEPPNAALPAGGARCHLALRPGDRIIGAGERGEPLDRRSARITFWNTDPSGPHSETTGAMYASVPFWTVLGADGRAWGVFMDSAGRSDLDAGASDPHELSFGVASGDLTFYVLAGPTPAEVVRQYTELTGRAPLPPRWALGYGQSRWSYYPDAHVREIAEQFRARRIPCDHLWLDIDYMDGYRVFTWSPTRFPNAKGLLDDLRAHGFKVVTIIDPGVKADPTDPTFADGVKRDYFIRRPDGTLFTGVIWPGESVFADYTREEVRAWWGERHAALLDAGVAGVWDDMNEPSLTDRLVPGAGTPHGTTMTPDALHRPDGPDGDAVPHARLHNAYGLLMARATREGLERARPDERAFVLARAGYAGIQRYAALWTGDNHSRWEHLRLAARMCLSLGMSGVPLVGFDTGGFWGAPTGEMLTRFTQLGALFPFFRNHSARDTPPQEPWALGQPFETFIRQAIELRYRLLPYFYTLAEEASRTGAPITRPMLYHWPDDPTVAGLDDQFTIGADLLAAPAFTPDPRQRDVRMPNGVWRDWITGQRQEGPVTARIDLPLDTLPLFQRESSIIPLGPMMQYTGELAVEELTLLCALGPEPDTVAVGSVYQDDGASRAYERGEWRRTAYHVNRDGNAITLRAEQTDGGYTAAPAPLTLDLRLPRADLDPATPNPAALTLTLDGVPLDIAERVSTERRRYETVLRVHIGQVSAPFTLELALRDA